MGKKINLIHIVLVVVVVFVIAFTIIKFSNWGEYVDLDKIFSENSGKVYSDTLDTFSPLTDEHGVRIPAKEDDGETVIVAFGNAPFADDRNSKDSLAGLIEDMTGATVYNCSVSGSYLASIPYKDYVSDPRNAFNFYWLCHFITNDVVRQNYLSAMEEMGTAAPPDAMEVYNTLTSIDFEKVDVITIMYDGSDYLAGHLMYSDLNPEDIDCFTGNLEAGIGLLRENFPHIRIIVLSPTYAFSDKIDEKTGKYMSSDMVRYGQDVLSTYVIKQYDSCSSISVTFVDNLYGTVTGANAEQYLIDNLHLNVEGRKKVAARFVQALTYFD